MSADHPTLRIGRYRWVICALLFAATAINYIDRQTIGVLKPTLQAELHWTESSYADIVFWFQCAYAIGYLGFGPIIDRIGARLGYALAFSVWTLAHIGHGFVHSITQFASMRFTLGLGESGSFPASLKSVSEWFPQKERALAVGVFNAGSNVGAIITPLVVPAITLAWGWRAAFVATGAVTFVWLIAWLAIYRSPDAHKKLSAAELKFIRSSDEPAMATAMSRDRVSWLKLLTIKETWAYALGKFLTDPIWWLYLFWLPDFLSKRHSLDLKSFGPPLVAIYLLSDIGSVAGGWGSSRLMKIGRTVNAARKITMLICAVAVVPILFAQFVSQLWIAVAIIGLAAAAHQAWSANLMTLPSDMFPRAAVGSVVGIGGTAGAVGGMLMSKFNGYILGVFGSYQPIFALAGSAYLVAIVVIHVLSPKLTRVTVAAVQLNDS
ncbi:MAG TPA: MFS transporter [Steroidobacteraceae bacterium]|nr:MFS transporter [Steroidobacteraceae bacterium]